MSNLQAFFAQNAEKVGAVEEVVSTRFKDAEGNPMKWKFGAIDGKVDERIKKECTKEVPVLGRKGVTIPKLDNDAYTTKLAIESIVFPDLKNAELQDSYGVKSAEDLFKVMLLIAEQTDAKVAAQKANGFKVDMEDLVEQAKN